MIDRFFLVTQGPQTVSQASAPQASAPQAAVSNSPGAQSPGCHELPSPDVPAADPFGRSAKASSAVRASPVQEPPVREPPVPDRPIRESHGGGRGRAPKSRRRKVPEPAASGVGTSYAAFMPLRPEVNEPQPADDPFGESFAAAGDDDWWQYEDEEQASVEEREQQLDDDAESWAYDSVDTTGLTDDDDDVVSSSPVREDLFHAFLSRRRRIPKETKSVYTGPQLVLEDDDDD